MDHVVEIAFVRSFVVINSIERGISKIDPNLRLA
jgi:hypothetical protein